MGGYRSNYHPVRYSRVTKALAGSKLVIFWFLPSHSSFFRPGKAWPLAVGGGLAVAVTAHGQIAHDHRLGEGTSDRERRTGGSAVPLFAGPHPLCLVARRGRLSPEKCPLPERPSLFPRAKAGRVLCPTCQPISSPLAPTKRMAAVVVAHCPVGVQPFGAGRLDAAVRPGKVHGGHRAPRRKLQVHH